MNAPIAAIKIGDRFRKNYGDIDALAQSIADIGLLQPIGLTSDLQLVFGHRRVLAAQRLGWTEIPARVIDISEIVLGEHAENEIRKDFTPSERVAILDAIPRKSEGRPNGNSQYFASLDEAAHLAGFGNRETARQARAVVAHGIPELVEAMDAGDLSISAAAEIAREPVERQQAIVAERINSTFRTAFTGKCEWFTPVEYIALARQVLGEIDLDPASCEFAQQRIQARRFYTVEDDGLAQEWTGRVWLNPPYSQPEIVHFVEKMVASVLSGAVTEAILLTNNYTDTAWFHHAESACAAICFTRGRIRFEDETSVVSAPVNGQSFFYYGANVDRFRQVFGTIGFVR